LETFDVPADRLRQDLIALAEELQKEGLLQVH